MSHSGLIHEFQKILIENFYVCLGAHPTEKAKMESGTTTPLQAIHSTSTPLTNHEEATGKTDLKRKENPSTSYVKSEGTGSTADFDLTDYDLKAHILLCAELLNGEGVDRLPEETDAELVSRLWESWNEGMYLLHQGCHDQRSDIPNSSKY